MRTTRIRSLCAVLVLAAVAGACGGSNDDDPPARTASNTVTISGFLFKPEALSVPAGTTVTWTNTDDIAHTVTGGMPGMPSGAFDSGSKVKNETFAHAFPAAGSFPYFCSNHTSMRGRITVT